jgi:hypothetical protein
VLFKRQGAPAIRIWGLGYSLTIPGGDGRGVMRVKGTMMDRGLSARPEHTTSPGMNPLLWNSEYIIVALPRTPRARIVVISYPLTFTVLTIVKHRQSIAAMSDYSGSPSDHMESQPPKRKATTAGLDGNTTGRSVKRRASKACQCCRARKVRCNVTEHGAPCTNCRLDEVECIVSESRRKKSVTHPVQHPTTPHQHNSTLYTSRMEFPVSDSFVVIEKLDRCSLLLN